MQSSESLKRVCPMDEHERFVKFYDAIPDNFRSYSANFVWTVGLFCLANGWLLSSASSRDFIRTSVLAYVGALIVTSTIGLLHTAVCWGFYLRSQARITQLTTEYEDLSPLPFRDYEISRPILAVNLLVSWASITSLIVLLTAAHTSLPS
jgi:hypothetical protein